MLAAALAALLLLTGCSLAQPERKAEQGDRWVGFYVMPEGRGSFYDNPNLTEYGTDSIDTEEFGALTFSREVLFAVKDGAGKYTFPGLEKGFSLFVYREYSEDASDHKGLDYAVGVASNMAPGEETTQISYTDEGVSYSASGTIYYGPPLGVTDWDAYENRGVWAAYRVFQAADGGIYLDGSGNSYSGGGSSFTETRTYTYAENGETVKEDKLTAAVKLQPIPRLEKLLVTQFDKTNAVVRSDDLALREALPEIDCEPETAWVLVEEISKGGTVRTLYNVPEEGEDPVSHQVVLLDGEGLGRLAYLTIQ